MRGRRQPVGPTRCRGAGPQMSTSALRGQIVTPMGGPVLPQAGAPFTDVQGRPTLVPDMNEGARPGVRSYNPADHDGALVGRAERWHWICPRYSWAGSRSARTGVQRD